MVYERNIGSRYKPILVFSQGKVGDLPMLQDVIQGIGAEKDFHEWQQNIGEAIHFIEAYTQAGGPERSGAFGPGARAAR